MKKSEEFTKLAVLLGVLALGFGCSSDDRPEPIDSTSILGDPGTYEGCEHADFTPCSYRERDCQEAIFEALVCVRQGPEGPVPPIESISEAELAALLRSHAEQVEPIDPHLERSLDMLGLAEQGSLQIDEVVDTQVMFVLALYVFEDKKILVIDRSGAGDLDDIDGVFVLAHELTHALQDRERDLRRFEVRFGTTFDSLLAIVSLIEGEATIYENVIGAISAGLDADQFTSRAHFSGLEQAADEVTFETGSPIATGPLIVPYTYGAQFAGIGWREGGPDAIRDLFSDPPLTTRNVIAPFDPVAPEQLVDVAAAPPSALDGFSLAGEDSLGAWVLFTFVGQWLAPIATGWQLGLDWRGDHFWVYGSDDGAVTTAVWKLSFAAEASAADFASLVQSSVPPGGGEWDASAAGTEAVLVATTDAANLDRWLSAATVSDAAAARISLGSLRELATRR